MNISTLPKGLRFVVKTALELGLLVDDIPNSRNKVLIRNADYSIFFIASNAAPGFYPTTPRWFSQLAANKDLATAVLKANNFNTIETTVVRSSEELPGHIPYPVLVKPNKGLRGIGVDILSDNLSYENYKQMNPSADEQYLIQPILDHPEYRLLILDGTLRMVYEKRPAHIVGDGTSTIDELLQHTSKKHNQFIVTKNLADNNLSLSDVLEKDRTITIHLLKQPFPGCVIDTSYSPELISWSESLARTFNTPVVGVDVFVPNSLDDPASFIVIEINSNPSINTIGENARRPDIAQELYSDVLRQYFKLTT